MQHDWGANAKKEKGFILACCRFNSCPAHSTSFMLRPLRKRLVLETEYGLANKLLAIASAIRIGEKFDRPVSVFWQPSLDIRHILLISGYRYQGESLARIEQEV